MIHILIPLLLLIPARAALVAAEHSLIRSRRSALRSMAARHAGAHAALRLAGQPERVDATVRLALLLLDFLIGAAAALALAPMIWSALTAVGATGALTVLPVGVASVVVVTTLVFALCDLAPRRLAQRNPEALACRLAPALSVLVRGRDLVFRDGGEAPILATASGSATADSAPSPPREGDGERSDSNERALLDRVMRLSERSAENLMTPRTRIAWLDLLGTREENLEVLRQHPYSRYPVYRGSDHDVVGILESRSLARLLSAGAHPDLFAELLPPTFVSESTRALRLLETFRDEGTHMALVVDEYGDLQGLVTLDDLLGAVMGQMRQQEDDADADARVVEREDGSWLVDGGLSSEDLRELLGLEQLPGEQDHDFNTAAGMVVARYGRIPAPGEHFEHAGWRVEVVDLDGARVDKLLIQRAAITPSNSDGQ